MSKRLLMFGCLAGMALVLAAATRGDDAAPPADAAPQKVLVLLNGRVITGDVQDRPGGYLIDNSIGSVVIPFTQVRLSAVDLPDAYRKLKASITEPTASAHVALGEWCYANRLYDSALEQVKTALVLEPERKEARTLLKQIERITMGNAVEATIPTAGKTRDGFDAAEATSLEGLSPGVTQDFVRKVQPLLMNKCGNARCHGPAGESEFRLTPVRLGMSGYRSLTDQNLAAVLRMLDPQHPRASALLVVPQGEHGGKGLIWNGPRSEEQLAEMRAWVTRAVLEKSQTLTGVPTRTADGEIQPAGGTDEGLSATRRDPLLRQILDEERPDRFDPAVFNRLMHGRD